MSTKDTQKSCAFCHAYLFEEDDVVYCPVCGAPHHRECYNAIGHCALEDDHGTENQYDILKAKEKTEAPKHEPVNENFTQNNNSANADYTPGDEFFANLPPMDFLGGVPADTVIEDGVTAKEARNFVISNTPRYIPKFVKLSKTNKASWNFMAFFFPAEWLLSRKMYKKGILVGIFMIISALLAVPLSATLYNLGFFDLKTIPEITEFFAQNLGNIHYGSLLAFFAGSAIELTLRIVFGVLGDYIYRNHAVSQIKEIKQTSDHIAEDFRRNGGVNFFAFLIGFMLIRNLPSIIAAFI